jgi:hypothetical protein
MNTVYLWSGAKGKHLFTSKGRQLKMIYLLNGGSNFFNMLAVHIEGRRHPPPIDYLKYFFRVSVPLIWEKPHMEEFYILKFYITGLYIPWLELGWAFNCSKMCFWFMKAKNSANAMAGCHALKQGNFPLLLPWTAWLGIQSLKWSWGGGMKSFVRYGAAHERANASNLQMGMYNIRQTNKTWGNWLSNWTRLGFFHFRKNELSFAKFQEISFRKRFSFQQKFPLKVL